MVAIVVAIVADADLALVVDSIAAAAKGTQWADHITRIPTMVTSLITSTSHATDTDRHLAKAHSNTHWLWNQ